MTRAIPGFLAEFLKKAEGVKLRAYMDSVGVWTVGVGHTGPEVHKGLVITMAVADKYLAQDMAVAAARLEARIGPSIVAALTDHQYAALVSFVFNLGANPKWTLWRLLRAGDFAGVPDQMMRFVKGKVDGVLVEIPGLKYRRLAEVAIWQTADAAKMAPIVSPPEAALEIIKASPSAPLPSSQVRAMETPPTPPVAGPLVKSRAFMSGIGAAVLGAPALLKEIGEGFLKPVMDAISPFSDRSEAVSNMVGTLATVAAVLVAVSIAFQIYNSHRDRN